MSDEFKRKLDAYEKGELSGSELEAFEQDLEKLEQYQAVLENDDVKDKENSDPEEKKQRNILRRGKWKARFQTAFYALIIIIFITIVSSILTNIYYTWGSPERMDVLSDVIDHTLTVTDPYGGSGGTSINAGPFFNMTATRDLKKRIGDDTIKEGEM